MHGTGVATTSRILKNFHTHRSERGVLSEKGGCLSVHDGQENLFIALQ
jgi:hypothetical protein